MNGQGNAQHTDNDRDQHTDRIDEQPKNGVALNPSISVTATGPMANQVMTGRIQTTREVSAARHSHQRVDAQLHIGRHRLVAAALGDIQQAGKQRQAVECHDVQPLLKVDSPTDKNVKRREKHYCSVELDEGRKLLVSRQNACRVRAEIVCVLLLFGRCTGLNDHVCETPL